MPILHKIPSQKRTIHQIVPTITWHTDITPALRAPPHLLRSSKNRNPLFYSPDRGREQGGAKSTTKRKGVITSRILFPTASRISYGRVFFLESLPLLLLQPTLHLFIQKQIRIHPEKQHRHHKENNQLMEPICLLHQHQHHHHQRKNPHKRPHFSPRPLQSKQTMMNMSIIPLHRIFLEHEHPIPNNPNRIKNHQR